MSDIAVASSRREGLPVNIMEAMGCGLPVVCTDVRGHRDLIDDGKFGFLIPLTDASGNDQSAKATFAKRIETLILDKAKAKQMSKAAVEAAKGYARTEAAKEMIRVYEKFMD